MSKFGEIETKDKEKFSEEVEKKIKRIEKTEDNTENLKEQLHQLEFENRKYRNRVKELEKELDSKKETVNALKDSKQLNIEGEQIEQSFILFSSAAIILYSIISENLLLSVPGISGILLYYLHFGD